MSDKNSFFKKEDLEKVKLSFKRITLKQSLTFFAFILLASTLWILQVKNQTINIPVKFQLNYDNISNDVIFDNTLPNEIEVYLKDKGSTFGHYLKNNADTINIDVAPYLSTDKTKSIITDAELESIIKTKILPSSEIINKKPSLINLSFHPSQSKKVPVKFNGVLKLAIGYQLAGKIEITPHEILIKGSKANLDTINTVYTVNDTLDNLKNNEIKLIGLQSIPGVTIIPNIVEMEIPTEEFVQKSFKIPVHLNSEKHEVTVSFFPSAVNVSFFVSKKYVDVIKVEDFKINVDYQNLVSRLETHSITLSEQNIEYPNYVRIQSIEPHDIEFIMMNKKN